MSSEQPTSSGQHLIMKDQKQIKRAVRNTTIIMNSRDRNLITYPKPSQFRYRFRRPLTNITSIELVSGSIPGLLYNINTGWNQFTFQENGIQYGVTLTPGYYSTTALAVELIKELNGLAIVSGNVYTSSVDPITQKLTLATTGSNAFSLLFKSGNFKDDVDPVTLTVLSVNCPASILGFGRNDYSSSSKIIVAPTPMDIENFCNRIYLHLNDETNQSLHRIEMSAGRRDAFHIFFMSPGAQNYLFLDKETHLSMYESNPAPISRMAGLEVSFRDEFYRLVDFQGREVNLIFEISHLE